MARIFQDTHEKRLLGDKAPWWIEWRDNGRRRSQKIGSKAKAKLFKANKEAEALHRRNGIQIDKPWVEFVAEYEREKMADKRPRSREEMARILKLFGQLMKPKFVGLIDYATLQAYKTKRLASPGKKKGDKLAAATVRKELRTICAALAEARERGYTVNPPTAPSVAGDVQERGFVTVEHFEAMLATIESQPLRLPKLESPAGQSLWWKTLLVLAWVSGMRISSLLALKWTDVDLDAGKAISRAKDNKSRKPKKANISPAVPLLRQLKQPNPMIVQLPGVAPRLDDPRVFPWHHNMTALYGQFVRIQEAAGIKLHCPGSHTHTRRCHVYGFHDFRRAHATYNYGRVSDRQLQEQMGHASMQTTEGYIKFAKSNQDVAYDMYLPDNIKSRIAQ